MVGKRVLIVDDQRDIRQLLRDSIQLLMSEVDIGNVDVVDVPSGEEAMLVISRQRFDLLVSDVRLAGMSGLELVRKLRKRNPGLKVILITGLTDIEIRQQVSQAGAEAFFFKPVDIGSFQSAVLSCLELQEVKPSISPPEKMGVNRFEGREVIGSLVRLRDALKAECVFWLDTTGEIRERIGEFPEGLDEKVLTRSALEMERARATLFNQIGGTSPGTYFVLSGNLYHLYLADTDNSTFLLAIAHATDANPKEDAAGEAMTEAAKNLYLESTMERTGEVEIQGSELAEELLLGEEDLAKLDEVFQRSGVDKANTKELDQFWDVAAEQASSDIPSESGSIPYEQALRLGIAPTNDQE